MQWAALAAAERGEPRPDHVGRGDPDGPPVENQLRRATVLQVWRGFRKDAGRSEFDDERGLERTARLPANRVACKGAHYGGPQAGKPEVGERIRTW